jgi:hypothetical protein
MHTVRTQKRLVSSKRSLVSFNFRPIRFRAPRTINELRLFPTGKRMKDISHLPSLSPILQMVRVHCACEEIVGLVKTQQNFQFSNYYKRIQSRSWSMIKRNNINELFNFPLKFFIERAKLFKKKRNLCCKNPGRRRRLILVGQSTVGTQPMYGSRQITSVRKMKTQK